MQYPLTLIIWRSFFTSFLSFCGLIHMLYFDLQYLNLLKKNPLNGISDNNFNF